jgi:uncharacterized protein YbjT (DUF2867 family)
MRMAVAGGTGWIGKLVVEVARQQGHTPVVIARSQGVDLVAGTGLDAGLEGVDVVIDVTNVTTTRKKTSVAFFGAATGNLLGSELRNGVRHHVALSIVGIDRVGLGYYQGKLRQEELIEAGSVPWTILRATQFHEFAAQMLANAVGPVVPVAKMQTQPVAAREVAELLVQLAAGPPRGSVPEIAGPQVLDLVTMVREVIDVRGLKKKVLALAVPGATGKALTHGGLLPLEPGPRGTQTFAQWLDSPAGTGAGIDVPGIR